jgi:L-2-hydroxyglutarate oxidase LhgO
MDYDVIIVGGGVVGLACAAIVSKQGHSCALIERHESFGRETSSRNSEVIHAGIYYPKGSLKAKLCVAGNRSLYDWCARYDIPHRRIGKYIIAVDDTEIERLYDILARGIDNGVERLCEAEIGEVRRGEPNVRCKAALWSPDTGIIDSHSLMQSLHDAAKENGCDFAWKHNLRGIELLPGGLEAAIEAPDGELLKLSAKYIINSAGLDSDIIAEMAGLSADKCGYRLHYCRGHYFRIVPSKKDLVNHLIYPVPPINMTSLGIHVTKELDGSLKLGPDTMYLKDRIQDYTVPEYLGEKFFDAASRHLIGLQRENIYPDQSGIRSKLQPEGGAYRDFVIREEKENGIQGLINLIGIESPGLTSCLEIAGMAADFIH